MGNANSMGGGSKQLENLTLWRAFNIMGRGQKFLNNTMGVTIRHTAVLDQHWMGEAKKSLAFSLNNKQK